jgi:SAM-dependent methyltransferase
MTESMWSDADLYDMENADDPTFDHGYWEWVMRSVQPGRVLELACGTGRLTLFLASLGIAREVVALDQSEPFLERLRSRLVNGSPVTAVCGDMREPAVDGPFDLIVIPFNSLSYLATREDRLACLRAARALLAPGGRLAFDLIAPRYDFLDEATGSCPTVRSDADHPAVEFGVDRFLRSYTDRYDPSTQTLHSTNRYALHFADGTVEHRVTDLDWHIYFPEELGLLLDAAGLEVLERYGSYALEPWSPASRRYLWLAGAR